MACGLRVKRRSKAWPVRISGERKMSASLLTEEPGASSTLRLPYTADRSLIRHGCVMTLLGLVSGLTTGIVKAPTAALEAHTIGLLQLCCSAWQPYGLRSADLQS
jgi:hypothetical protein